jgi:hypothetical protein
MVGMGGRLLSYAKSLTLIPKIASVETEGCSDAAWTDAFISFKFEAFLSCRQIETLEFLYIPEIGSRNSHNKI